MIASKVVAELMREGQPSTVETVQLGYSCVETPRVANASDKSNTHGAPASATAREEMQGSLEGVLIIFLDLIQLCRQRRAAHSIGWCFAI